MDGFKNRHERAGWQVVSSSNYTNFKVIINNLIRILLNNNEVTTALPPGTVLLDLIRYHQRLTGTKIGCREGDCGACTVLVGELKEGGVHYQSMTSCLMPIGNAQGKHIVTIEGINTTGLNPVQQAMADAGATQCGFCTPGFVMSLAGFCLSDKEPTSQNAIAAIDGNICRCTGYKSIERAATRIAELKSRNEPLLPDYFSSIKEKLTAIHSKTNGSFSTQENAPQIIGGGTDLYVQKHDEMTDASIRFVFDNPTLNGICKEGNSCIIGPSTTVTDLKNSELINAAFPNFQQYAKLVSSTPIRNMATIAGNFINASPIGDFTVFFLALNARITLTLRQTQGDNGATRVVSLRKLYKGYKQLDKTSDEYITAISFELPTKNSLFHFEKVSKRTNLDIATVNTAIKLQLKDSIIEEAGLSAGGVAPVPLFLEKTSAFLKGKKLSEALIYQTIETAQTEVSPISDARGTAEYKRLLLSQLIKAHFISLFPQLEISKLLA
jgi:xanthine dehydrogenase small subunit